MKAFITGANGFVGKWLQQHLIEKGDEVIAPEVDITDGDSLNAAISSAKPEAIYHLAALTHVGDSWDAPKESFRVNAMGTLNVLEAARHLQDVPKVLLVCSAEVYGVVKDNQLPLKEDIALAPVTPYAVSKVAAEFLGIQAYLAYGLPVIRVRAFNHIGPHQASNFVVSALAKRIVEAKKNGSRVLEVGNITTRRDFTDVRDVTNAYSMLIEKGSPGEVYNVCSGVDISIEQLAAQMIELSGANELKIKVDPALERPVDIPILRGDRAKIEEATGWKPQIPLEQTLKEVLRFWQDSQS